MQGLYLISNDDPFDALQQKLAAALDAAPVALFQYRRKQVDKIRQPVEVESLLKLCAQYKTPLIINDDVGLARQFDCGVHLGQGDGSLEEARRLLGTQVIIGRTCHASLELAEWAAQEGASYLAFGAVYPSSTKPNAQRVSLETLKQAAQSFSVPICAIGGLTVENSLPVKQAGVDLFAVVGDVFGLPVQQVGERVKRWDTLLRANPTGQ